MWFRTSVATGSFVEATDVAKAASGLEVGDQARGDPIEERAVALVVLHAVEPGERAFVFAEDLVQHDPIEALAHCAREVGACQHRGPLANLREPKAGRGMFAHEIFDGLRHEGYAYATHAGIEPIDVVPEPFELGGRLFVLPLAQKIFAAPRRARMSSLCSPTNDHDTPTAELRAESVIFPMARPWLGLTRAKGGL